MTPPPTTAAPAPGPAPTTAGTAAADPTADPTPGPSATPPVPALLDRAALGAFRLNARLLAVSEEIARPAGLTAAWWQVLGAVLREPLSVAAIARTMGITRQSVQRIADLLTERGLTEYVPNPAHRRAKLLRPTDAGRAAVTRITPAHAELATSLSTVLGGSEEFERAVEAVERLAAALERHLPPPA
ncbi:MarR family winged helix-turn-helix transcriptional regulator [Streptomyces sp. BI20]|uniref:MarR family winged helix-turn-helix transcriptional regulator n=1 Tax=Streptomyces sp. BI20 TaxID=3403460 RepID=UPI003C72231A